jgi:hypothetical protein
MKKSALAIAVGICGILIYSFVVMPSQKHGYLINQADLLKEDLLEGAMLECASDEYLRMHKRYPSKNELNNLVPFCETLSRMSELFSNEKRVNSTNVYTRLTGQGGWVYNQESGVVIINITNTVRFIDGFEFVPSEIRFNPLPVNHAINAYTNGGMQSFLLRLPFMIESVTNKLK